MSFTHFDQEGNAIMVDVGEKGESRREAAAIGRIQMSEECLAAIVNGTSKKGDVLGVARVAGIMAVKKTSELIPLCHMINITKAEIGFQVLTESLEVEVVCTVSCYGKTGVEMEALTGASVSLLTIYDMCKAIDKAMVIKGIYLSHKTGGKSGEIRNLPPVWKEEKKGKRC